MPETCKPKFWKTKLGIALGIGIFIGQYVTIKAAYFVGWNYFKTANPTKWPAEYVIKKASAEEKKENDLAVLAGEIIKKAEKHDGLEGLSLDDKNYLLRELGFNENIGEKDRFMLYSSPYKPELKLRIGEKTLTISEKKAEEYLNKK